MRSPAPWLYHLNSDTLLSVFFFFKKQVEVSAAAVSSRTLPTFFLSCTTASVGHACSCFSMSRLFDSQVWNLRTLHCTAMFVPRYATYWTAAISTRNVRGEHRAEPPTRSFDKSRDALWLRPLSAGTFFLPKTNWFFRSFFFYKNV